MVLNTCRMESGGCEMNKTIGERVNGKVVFRKQENRC